jgi:hypothetical protein
MFYNILEKDVLPEMMESIHVVLFLVFGVFMIQILILLLFAYRQGKKWHRAEKSLLVNKSVAFSRSGMSDTEFYEFEAIRTQVKTIFFLLILFYIKHFFFFLVGYYNLRPEKKRLKFPCGGNKLYQQHFIYEATSTHFCLPQKV